MKMSNPTSNQLITQANQPHPMFFDIFIVVWLVTLFGGHYVYSRYITRDAS